MARISEAEMQRKLLIQEVEQLLKGFVAAGKVSVYVLEPEMSTRDLPSGSERVDADKLVACVQQEQALQMSLEPGGPFCSKF